MENFQQIIELLRKQDKTALLKLYELYGKKFYSYCISKWHLTADDAWDVVYRTLETLILKISGYSLESQVDFDRFVYKVLINFLRQHYRSSQALKAKEIEYVNLDGIDTDKAFLKYINEASLLEYYRVEAIASPEILQLKSALERLDDVDRDLLLLRAQNFSYEEIAGLLRIENHQLKVRHHRAKKKLIEMLTSLQPI